MNMAHAIAWIFEALLRLWLPSSGRHRAADTADGRPAVQHQNTPTMRTAQVPDVPAWPMVAECVNGSTVQFRPISGPPDGHGADMVRPHVVAHEQRQKSRPRVELLCAPHGMVVIR
ncbi:hypothetical protein [Streptomyces coffeae]|uniref:Secreted protein n=1 Tax=Streptomyces coffeae TaxID=621382 RepID=A0ABS1N6L9_9ACTN|nr:hypothetical protein [Streptomyces coffeae]MBL1095545.1 hypothetical protein [Streptomyces coffeae]